MNSSYSRFNKKTDTSSLLSWIRLVRLPNLFTAIGDPLAGLCAIGVLAKVELHFLHLLFLPLCSMLFYAAGIILNDWHDIAEDRRHNPTRPLPAGEISPTLAFMVALLMMVLALFIALFIGRMTFIIALLLALAIITYDSSMKKYLKRGAVCMGLCRGLSLLLGASIMDFSAGMIIPFLTVVLYAANVTILADNENRSILIPDKDVFYPALLFAGSWLLGLIFIFFSAGKGALLPSAILALLGAGSAAVAALRIYNRSIHSKEMHSFIGILLTSMIPMQGSWIVLAFSTHGWLILGCCLALWLITALLGKLIPQS